MNFPYGVILRLNGRSKVVRSTSSAKRNSVVFCSLAVDDQVSKVSKGNSFFEPNLIKQFWLNRFRDNHQGVKR